MDDNRIDATLSQADKDAIMAALAAIRQKLPFLIDLSLDERRATYGQTGRQEPALREQGVRCGGAERRLSAALI